MKLKVLKKVDLNEIDKISLSKEEFEKEIQMELVSKLEDYIMESSGFFTMCENPIDKCVQYELHCVIITNDTLNEIESFLKGKLFPEDIRIISHLLTNSH